MGSSRRPSIYDQLRSHLDAADLIRRLGIEEARRIGSEAYCRPLCHDSQSGESLQINLDTGRWNCKACQHSGVRGDLVQLVEYVLSGGAPPSHGNAQGASASHRAAVRWLCEQYGVVYDFDRAARDPGLDVVHLFAMLAHEHLLAHGENVLAWIQERWGFDRGTVEAYGIGFMPSPILPAILEEAQHSSSRDAFRSSGLGWYDGAGRWQTHFEGRVLFPYLEHGRAVYLIGRSTPWTPARPDGRGVSKYHKLSVHSERRPYVSQAITNDHLYNELVMNAADAVVVAEGVADAVALSTLGVPVVSPVTISFNATDLERFVRKCHENQIARVEILFDNELSGSGNFAARRVGRKLIEHGIVVRIITLPLGPTQKAAREDVLGILGQELFDELERSDPLERKEILGRATLSPEQHEWLKRSIAASKIDAAEWVAQEGAGAAGRFSALRSGALDVIDLEIDEVLCAHQIDNDQDPSERLALFGEVVKLVAHIDDSLSRGGYAAKIARAAGKGVTKADVAQRIAQARKALKPKLEEQKKAAEPQREPISLVLLPPEVTHATPPAPPPPEVVAVNGSPGAPAAPPPPTKPQQNEHQRYAPAREAVAASVEVKASAEQIGEYIAQLITVSMGYTPFRTPDDLHLVRGSERVPTGLERISARFESLLFLVSGLTPKNVRHRAYIAAVVYFLERGARRVDDVSWSFVDPSGSIYFPTGDSVGRILQIEPGKVTQTRMADARVPAVAGAAFLPFEYVERSGGVAAIYDVLRWTSISPSDRLVLVHWIACLPILRRVGMIPIVRVEGGSSSGKTRTVETVGYLVNGQKSSSVPTAAALISRLSSEMLTVDDNRETGDVTPAFLGTLLQATHLGAREKRKGGSDTGTVVERVCGALIMSGVEPIHDGRPELASRIIVLRCNQTMRAPDSPVRESKLRDAILEHRDAFWSEAMRLCSIALELDEQHGEHIGRRIETIFEQARIGRLSAYLRMMYLTWVARSPEQDRGPLLEDLSPVWVEAFASIAGAAIGSLLTEELAVNCMRYLFAWARAQAQARGDRLAGTYQLVALDGRYVEQGGECYLAPMRISQIARFIRQCARDWNAPLQIQALKAGQLEQRILDGLGFLREAGIETLVETTAAGVTRYAFRMADSDDAPAAGPAPAPPPPGRQGGDWQLP